MMHDDLLRELIERITRIESKFDELDKKYADHILKENKFFDDYTKYKGFLGGIVFVISALWIFLTSSYEKIFNSFK